MHILQIRKASAMSGTGRNEVLVHTMVDLEARSSKSIQESLSRVYSR